MSRAERLAPELVWNGQAFEAERVVEIDAEGRIAEVRRRQAGETEVRAMPGVALLPGFVNAHSHAFQRGLRGRGETFPGGAGSFWSWRSAMYGLVGEMDADRMHALCLQAYREMLQAGITAVGEFHYLHHERSGDWAFDDAVIAAAKEAGIRLVLLEAFYARGGFDRPLEDAQKRFETASPTEFLSRLDELGARLTGSRQHLGAVVHSVRAAGAEEIAEVGKGALGRGLVLHMHAEEQRREIEECVAQHGETPLDLIVTQLGGATGVTAVHGTHTSPESLGRFLDAGGNLCVCPLTEANLGDGLPDLAPAVQRGTGLCLGTDSNARISMLEEMRWLEYGQRLAGQRRGACLTADGAVAPFLLDAATRGGASSLGLDTGRIEAGAPADLVAIDLSADTLAGWDGEHLAAALIFGCDREAIGAVCVDGSWVHGAGAVGA